MESSRNKKHGTLTSFSQEKTPFFKAMIAGSDSPLPHACPQDVMPETSWWSLLFQAWTSVKFLLLVGRVLSGNSSF